jgi:hypothetical protein
LSEFCKLANYVKWLTRKIVYLQEIKEGRRVGRAELYRITHTNKDGIPVDDFSAEKIVSTSENFANLPY